VSAGWEHQFLSDEADNNDRGMKVSGSRDITKKGRIAAKSLAHRLTGFSLPFFGVQWTPPADEREIVRGLLTALEDRRVLFVPYHLEVVSQV